MEIGRRFWAAVIDLSEWFTIEVNILTNHVARAVIFTVKQAACPIDIMGGDAARDFNRTLV